MADNTKIDNPRPEWVELYRAPFKFRAEYDGADYSLAMPLKELAGKFSNSEIASFSLDEKYAALIVRWEWAEGTNNICETTKLQFPASGPNFQFLDDLRRMPPERLHDYLDHLRGYLIPKKLPSNLFDQALSVLADMAEFQLSFKREFYRSIDAGHCQVFARVGNPAAPFTQILGPLFRSYRIVNWGGREKGINLAQRSDLEDLFEIYAAPFESPSGKRGAKPKYNWAGAEEHIAHLFGDNGSLSKDDLDWASQAHVERAIKEYFQDSIRDEPGSTRIREKAREFISKFDGR